MPQPPRVAPGVAKGSPCNVQDTGSHATTTETHPRSGEGESVQCTGYRQPCHNHRESPQEWRRGVLAMYRIQAAMPQPPRVTPGVAKGSPCNVPDTGSHPTATESHPRSGEGKSVQHRGYRQPCHNHKESPQEWRRGVRAMYRIQAAMPQPPRVTPGVAKGSPSNVQDTGSHATTTKSHPRSGEGESMQCTGYRQPCHNHRESPQEWRRGVRAMYRIQAAMPQPPRVTPGVAKGSPCNVQDTGSHATTTKSHPRSGEGESVQWTGYRQPCHSHRESPQEWRRGVHAMDRIQAATPQPPRVTLGVAKGSPCYVQDTGSHATTTESHPRSGEGESVQRTGYRQPRHNHRESPQEGRRGVCAMYRIQAAMPQPPRVTPGVAKGSPCNVQDTGSHATATESHPRSGEGESVQCTGYRQPCHNHRESPQEWRRGVRAMYRIQAAMPQPPRVTPGVAKGSPCNVQDTGSHATTTESHPRSGEGESMQCTGYRQPCHSHRESPQEGRRGVRAMYRTQAATPQPPRVTPGVAKGSPCNVPDTGSHPTATESHPRSGEGESMQWTGYRQPCHNHKKSPQEWRSGVHAMYRIQAAMPQPPRVTPGGAKGSLCNVPDTGSHPTATESHPRSGEGESMQCTAYRQPRHSHRESPQEGRRGVRAMYRIQAAMPQPPRVTPGGAKGSPCNVQDTGSHPTATESHPRSGEGESVQWTGYRQPPHNHRESPQEWQRGVRAMYRIQAATPQPPRVTPGVAKGSPCNVQDTGSHATTTESHPRSGERESVQRRGYRQPRHNYKGSA
ncbi:hypothetical protein NDU88_011396 [Pleurodeles waltl]|uniref:Uncharacterized protein n=1 Tax=Pleurodeles waltl TaxID=8319 RepID=A0AAV7S3L3_PLEWA|nr:hypothetical protein NDU88_011396 [Pleurodeles waltl]